MFCCVTLHEKASLQKLIFLHIHYGNLCTYRKKLVLRCYFATSKTSHKCVFLICQKHCVRSKLFSIFLRFIFVRFIFVQNFESVKHVMQWQNRVQRNKCVVSDKYLRIAKKDIHIMVLVYAQLDCSQLLEMGHSCQGQQDLILRSVLPP